MKKTFSFLVLITIAATPVFAESLTLTTYYPAPFGAYDRLRLVPRDDLSGISPCDSGTLYIEEVIGDADRIWLCRDDDTDTGSWGPLSGVWTKAGNNIFPIGTSTNPDISVGIGTATPLTNLHIESAGPDPTTLRLQQTESTDSIWELRAMDFTGLPDNLNNDFAIWGGEEGNESYKMVIKGVSGNVGIGKTDPSTKLHVLGNSANTPPFDARITVENINAASKKSELCFARPDTGAGAWCLGTDFFAQNDDDFYIWGGGADGGSNQGRLYIDNTGNIGIGTNNPSAQLHLEGDSAAAAEILLKHNDAAVGSVGITFDVSGGEVFSIKSHDNKLKFITLGTAAAPVSTSRMTILPNGNVGIGTKNPQTPLHIVGPTLTIEDDQPAIRLIDNDTVDFLLTTDGSYFAIQVEDPIDSGVFVNKVRVGHNGGATIIENGRLRLVTNLVGIGTSAINPLYPLHFVDSGAYVGIDGQWYGASSIEYKENVEPLTLPEALEALADLRPVSFNYKVDKGSRHVGFIAEEVPDLVATKDRKTVTAMDFIGMLTRVVQHQQEEIEQQKQRIEALKARLDSL